MNPSPLRTLTLIAALSASFAFAQKRPESAVLIDVRNVFLQQPVFHGMAIEPSLRNGVVTLSGTVSSEAARELASDKVGEITGVRTVLNNLTVVEPGAKPAAAAVASPPAATPMTDQVKVLTLTPPATIPVRIREQLNTHTAKAGDTFHGVTATAVYQSGVVLIPAKTPVTGRVVSSKAARPLCWLCPAIAGADRDSSARSPGRRQNSGIGYPSAQQPRCQQWECLRQLCWHQRPHIKWSPGRHPDHRAARNRAGVFYSRSSACCDPDSEWLACAAECSQWGCGTCSSRQCLCQPASLRRKSPCRSKQSQPSHSFPSFSGQGSTQAGLFAEDAKRRVGGGAMYDGWTNLVGPVVFSGIITLAVWICSPASQAGNRGTPPPAKDHNRA